MNPILPRESAPTARSKPAARFYRICPPVKRKEKRGEEFEKVVSTRMRKKEMAADGEGSHFDSSSGG
jgi:hypothetical protein